jgi:hypothetical protein
VLAGARLESLLAGAREWRSVVQDRLDVVSIDRGLSPANGCEERAEWSGIAG